jgi:hypothetical protein
MNIIEKFAKESIQRNIEYEIDDYKDAISNIKEKIYDFDDTLDKIKFLSLHIDAVNKLYNEHLPKCNNPADCDINFQCESLLYFLRQEIGKFGVNVNEDTFTVEQKIEAEDKLDKILKQIEELKLGQQIIYDDLTNEISELKELYFLGKKKWHQMLAGKIVDMTVSGLVSETLSKHIIESLKPNFRNLIG